MDDVGHAYRARRTRVLNGIHRRYLSRFAVAATVAHAIVLVFFVAPDPGAGFESGAREIAVVDMPPETKIPPPPEEIPRPATPVLGTTEVEADVTIAETEIVENQAVGEGPPAPPPALAVEPEARPTFSFTPYTVKPRCTNGCSSDDLLRHVPPVLKKAGVSCRLTVGIRIDEEGRVTATDILRSSGLPACDESVSRWALETRWSTAYNRDQPVVVWIAQPVTVSSQ